MQKFRSMGIALFALAVAGGTMSSAHADSWRTTEADGTVIETPVQSANQPARDYKSTDALPRSAVGKGARITDPNFYNPQPRQNNNGTGVARSRIFVGNSYPYYPGYYYQPPRQPYGGPIGSGNGYVNPPWINVFPLDNGGGGYVPYPPYGAPGYGYPGYGPGYGYPGGVPVYPNGYYGYQSPPVWVHNGVTNGNGSYYQENNSRQNGISVGRGGVRLNVGNSTQTSRGSYSAWP
jgi:hypothetical protein